MVRKRASSGHGAPQPKRRKDNVIATTDGIGHRNSPNPPQAPTGEGEEGGNHDGSVTTPLLQTAYDSVMTLRSYLVLCVGEETVDKRFAQATPGLRDLLDTTLVGLFGCGAFPPATAASANQFRPSSLADPTCTPRELVGRAVASLPGSSAETHVLYKGLRAPRASADGCGVFPGAPRDATVRFYNSIHDLLVGARFAALWAAVGDAMGLHLMVETGLFLALSRGCFMQVTGVALSHLVQRGGGVPRNPANPAAPSAADPDRLVRRHRLFYSHWNTTSGLSDGHILSNVAASSRGARRLALAIFRPDLVVLAPLHGGAPSAAPAAAAAAAAAPGTANTSTAIKRRARLPQRLPARLVAVQGLLRDMIASHGDIQYRHLLNWECPYQLDGRTPFFGRSVTQTQQSATVSGSRPAEIDRSDHCGGMAVPQPRSQVRLEPTSLTTQLSTASHTPLTPTTMTAPEFAVLRSRTKLEGLFAKHTSHRAVFAYVRRVLQALLSPALLGGTEANRKHILKAVEAFVRLRRHDAWSVEAVMSGLTLRDFVWAWSRPRKRSGKRHARRGLPPTETAAARRLVSAWLHWLFDSLVVDLVASAFYATETAAFRNRVFYYRKPVWAAIVAAERDRLLGDRFECLTKAEAQAILAARPFSYSFVRLLPKTRSARPIVNLSRRPHAGEVTSRRDRPVSINTALRDAFEIVSAEREAKTALFAGSVMGAQEIFCAFRPWALAAAAAGTRLYFVAVDVKAAFDSIPHRRLMEVVEGLLLTSDAYFIKKYIEVTADGGRLRVRWRRAVTDLPPEPFKKTAAAAAAAARDETVFVDQVHRGHLERNQVAGLIREHICNNLVRVGGAFYRQTVGIPQGSRLSPTLCSLFYAALEREHLADVVASPGTIMLRLIDDFLLITPDRAAATTFAERMHVGFPDYGCAVNPAKTLANFDLVVNGEPVRRLRGDRFPWCGYLIDSSTLAVSVDYERWVGVHLRDTLRLDVGARPGASLRRKMRHFVRGKCHALFTDHALNGSRVVRLNLYQNLAFTAMKVHAGAAALPSIETRFLVALADNLARYAFRLISRAVEAADGCTCDLTEDECRALGAMAFVEVLRKKQTRFAAVLVALQSRFDRHSTEIKTMVKDIVAARENSVFARLEY